MRTDIETILRSLSAAGLETPPTRLQFLFDPSAGIDATAPAVFVAADEAALRSLAAVLAERYPPGHPVQIIAGDRQRVVHTTAAGLSSLAAPAGEATVYIPPIQPEADIRDFAGAVAIMRRLRDPETGCPWDREQTHGSLKRYLLEETYEALEALDSGDPTALREELGDLLLQIVLHGRIAEQAGEFTTRDVIEALNTKLLRRHPHVFGSVVADTAEEVAQNWDELKRAEKEAEADSSALGGVPAAMPALAYSQAVLGRAERAGFRWPARDDIVAKIAEEARELAASRDDDRRREELGDLLFALVSLARSLDLDAEEALRIAAAKFVRRFRAMERAALERETPLHAAEQAELRALWDEAKRSVTVDGR